MDSLLIAVMQSELLLMGSDRCWILTAGRGRRSGLLQPRGSKWIRMERVSPTLTIEGTYISYRVVAMYFGVLLESRLRVLACDLHGQF